MGLKVVLMLVRRIQAIFLLMTAFSNCVSAYTQNVHAALMYDAVQNSVVSRGQDIKFPLSIILPTEKQEEGVMSLQVFMELVMGMWL